MQRNKRPESRVSSCSRSIVIALATCAIALVGLWSSNINVHNDNRGQLISSSRVYAKAKASASSSSDKANSSSSKNGKNNSSTKKKKKKPSKSVDDSNTKGAGDSNSDSSKSTDSFATIVGDISKASSSQYKDISKTANLNAGNAWGVMASNNNIFGRATKSTYTIAYNTLFNMKEPIMKNQGYAGAYGMALNETGLDHSVQSGINNDVINRIARVVGGSLLMVGYMANTGVAWLFQFIAKAASYINPLTWVTNVPAHSPFSSVAMMIKNVYKGISALGLIGTALATAAAIAFGIMGWRVTGSSATTGYGDVAHGIITPYIRMIARVFIIIALPIMLGSLLSAGLQETKNAFGSGANMSSDYAIYSNLVDFQGWAEHSRLDLPNGTIPGLVATDDDSQLGVIDHNDVLGINALGAGRTNAETLYTAKVDGSQLTSKKNAKSGLTGAQYSMIMNWLTGSGYKPADWSSYVRSRLGKTSKGSGAVADMKTVLEGNKGAYYLNGTLSASKLGAAYKTKPAQYRWSQADGSNKLDASSTNGGISTIGMYNYLSSVFDSTDLTWTASTDLLNTISAPEHKTIGLAGRGVVALSNYMLMCALVFSIAILGFMFALAMIASLITGIPRIFGNLVGSGVGAFKSAIKLVVAVLGIIIDLVGGSFLFVLCRSVLISVAQIMDGIVGSPSALKADAWIANLGSLNHLPHSDVLASAGAISSFLYAGGNLVIAILLGYLVYRFIKLRGPILNIIYQIFENGLNSLYMSADTALGGRPTGGASSIAAEHGTPGANALDSSRTGSSTGGAYSDNGDNGRDGSDFNGNAGEGYGGAGDNSRSNRIGSPQSMIGRSFNSRQATKDAIRAKEAALGRPLSTAEKVAAAAGYRAQRLGQSTLGAVGKASGLDGLSHAAHDLRSAQDNRLSDRLANPNDVGSVKDAMKSEASPTASDSDAAFSPNDADINAVSPAGNPDVTAADVSTLSKVADEAMDRDGAYDGLTSNDPTGATDGDSTSAPTADQTTDATGSPVGDAAQATNADGQTAQDTGATGSPATDGDSSTTPDTGAATADAPADATTGSPSGDTMGQATTSSDGSAVGDSATEAPTGQTQAATGSTTTGHSTAAPHMTQKGDGAFGGAAEPGHLTGANNTMSGTDGVPLPQTAQANSQAIHSAVAGVQSADLAAKTIPASAPASEMQAVKTRQVAAHDTLRAHQVNAAKFAMASPYTPAPGKSISGLSTGQARHLIQNVGQSQERVTSAIRSGDHGAIQSATTAFKTATSDAVNAGVPLANVKTPADVQRSLSHVSSQVAGAIGGHADFMAKP